MAEFVRLLRRAVVRDRTALSNTQLHVMIKSGLFPAPSYLTDTNRIPVWDERVVNDWIKARLSSGIAAKSKVA
ncbi:AlpA family phage regulatory protein [Pelomonas sp. V22]|uniref:helix-turn-helix transcriptional regulator n=1 Tax=Pelomonas sp. V22 TaxID=2822139 RepID=UPI0024A90917|nr:AlpA family phage regulatory protein [Pelomonas sp. V22]MDI4633158.1 AlpA family phage regulatory protein [Pelomonas sp. V22]